MVRVAPRHLSDDRGPEASTSLLSPCQYRSLSPGLCRACGSNKGFSQQCMPLVYQGSEVLYKEAGKVFIIVVVFII